MKQKKHVVINGAGGRMGHELISLAQEDPRIFAVTGADTQTCKLKDLMDVPVSVVIDFSTPKGMLEALRFCIFKKAPLVSGTTGLSKSHFTQLKRASQKIPILWAPNMSLGIEALRKMLGSVRGLSGFDFQIEETHHRHKKDKPSGTARLLQEELKKHVKRAIPQPLSVRGGGIPGEHRILIMGEEEFLILQHTALNRRVFARGALEAAQWLMDRRKGLYTLEDILK